MAHGLRGQLSIELFLALALFLVVIVWTANYVNSFAASSSQATASVQAQAIASASVHALDAACAWGTNVTFHLPCAVEAGNYTLVNITLAQGGWVRAWIPAFNATANRTIACPGVGGVVYRCEGERGPTACANKTGSMVGLQIGGCP